jgi:hypothetical protein
MTRESLPHTPRRMASSPPSSRKAISRRAALVTISTGAVSLWLVSRSRPSTADPTPSTTAAPAAAEVVTTLPPIATPAPSVSQPAAPLDRALALGSVGATVKQVQSRLRDLGFDPGPADGQFGPATERAVWAFEKLVLGVPRAAVQGVVTPELWAALHGRVEIAPRRSPGGTHLEVYLPEQVAVLFSDGSPTLVTHISSGDGLEWCDEVTIDNDDGTQTTKGICGRSVTPGGVFHFERKYEGWRNAALGRLYNPVFFNYGIAVHGASNVPNRPVSHGCVRIPLHIAEYFPTLVEIGDTVFVFDGVEEPEHYGAQLPVFDWNDPDYVTTTTAPTSTSSATSTTTPATTTTHPHAEAVPSTTTSTTQPPATTTTSTPPSSVG